MASQAIGGASTDAKFPRNQVKPTATMSGPVPLFGRRHQPTRPQAMKDHPTARVRYPMARVVPTESHPFGGQPEQRPGGRQE